MQKNLKKGASSVGGTIAIVIVILILLLGAYYFWQYKIEPRLHRGSTDSSYSVPVSHAADEVEINLNATST